MSAGHYLYVDATFFLAMLGVSIFGPIVGICVGWWARGAKAAK